MGKIRLDDIPDMDPAEFDWYRSARRTDAALMYRIQSGILDTGHTLGWIPIGKTRHERILRSGGDDWVAIAIMCQFEGTDEMMWLHMDEN